MLNEMFSIFVVFNLGYSNLIFFFVITINCFDVKDIVPTKFFHNYNSFFPITGMSNIVYTNCWLCCEVEY